MKMMKLLGAASVAALIAGAANAQLEFRTAGTTFLANEVDFVALEDEGEDIGTFNVEIAVPGSLPEGEFYRIDINILGGATFGTTLDGDEFTAGAGVTDGQVTAGGTPGDDSVRFLVSADAAPTSLGGDDGFAIALPIQITDCDPITLDITTFQTESGGTPIGGGTATLVNETTGAPDNILECTSAFNAILQPDAQRTALNFVGGFTNFVAGGTDGTTTATLGDFSLTVNTAALIALTNPTTAAATMVEGFEANVRFADDTGIDEGEAVPGTGNLFDAGPEGEVGDLIELEGSTSGSAGVNNGTFTLDITGTAPVMAQNVSVEDAIILLDEPTLQDTDPFVFADVEDLVFNGSTFGPFDWVADTDGRVNSIFRVTGLGAITSTVPGLFILENSREGNNGAFPFSVAPTDVEGSEVRFTSATIEAAAGAFGTADVTMVFGSALNLDVDRLLSGPSTATVVPFGDNANADSCVPDANADPAITCGDADSIVRAPLTDDDDAGFFQ